MIFIPEVIGRVIDTLREEGNYTSWTNVGTTYTINAFNTLEENEWVFILDTGGELFGFEYTFPIVFTDDLDTLLESNPDVFGQFQVQNVTSTSFDIVSTTAPPSAGGYKSLEPFFMFGHRREISNRLLKKDEDKIYKYQKYPLFALRLPIIENISFDNVHDVELNIAILAFTEKNYRAPDRYTNVIHPVLMPLYFDFLEAIQTSNEIMTLGRPEHQKIDRLFWGISETEGNAAYIFNDPLDAVEMLDLNVKIIDNNC
jgi:hypothetical protein